MAFEERPSWIVRAENGELAEARTRAFLLDRFWVLERSVDIEGADFIVQRRLTSRSLFDRHPPRLGMIQAKFYASPSTTHYVHREYVVDAAGQPRPDFFLLCHTGTEGAARAYFLTAEQVSSSFTLTSSSARSNPNRFRLPGKTVLDAKYEIRGGGQELADIDYALQALDFSQNRAFLAWALPSLRIGERAPVIPDYRVPIDNWWGDIPGGFDKIRDAARNVIYEVEDMLDILRQIDSAADPSVALELAEGLVHDHANGSMLPDELYDADLHDVVIAHKKRVDALRAGNLLGAFQTVRDEVRRKTTTALASGSLRAPGLLLAVELNYNQDTLAPVSLSTDSLKEPPNGVVRSMAISGEESLEAAPGRVAIHLDAECCIDWYQNSRGGMRTTKPFGREEAIDRAAEAVAGRLMGAVLDMLVGESVE